MYEAVGNATFYRNIKFITIVALNKDLLNGNASGGKNGRENL
jgi:hypothetical protein